MQCPQCQSELISWHFYCPNCRAILQDFNPVEKPRRTRFEQLSREWTSWAAIGVFTIGSVVMALAIEWNELFSLLHAQPKGGGTDISETATERNGRPTKGSSRNGREAGDLSSAGQATDISAGSQPSPTPAESVRDLARRVDEIKTPSESIKNGDSIGGSTAEAAAGSKRASNGMAGLGPALPEPELRASGTAAVEIEWAHPPANSKTGLVTINSYVPARIYIDGQYSGVTPRSVHLLVGEHNLRLVADGYQEWTSRIRVRNQQQVGVIAAMTKTSGNQ